MKRQPVIAMDGPAGAGKSTVAREVARRKGFTYIDTGAMYRAVALKVLETGLRAEETEAIESFLPRTDILLVGTPDAEGTEHRAARVRLDGRDVTEAIRRPEVNRIVSLIAQSPAVRRHLVAQQQAMAARGGVVMDGRDVGTVVLPDAEYKFFLTASLEARAERRLQELRAKGIDVKLADVKKELSSRDTQDRGRAVSPLRKAEDAMEIDTTGCTIAEVVAVVLSACTTGVRR